MPAFVALFLPLVCLATAITATSETHGQEAFVLNNRSGSSAILYIRPATPFPGRAWSAIQVEPGTAAGFVLTCPDNYDVRLVYYPPNRTWEELGVDNVDLRGLAAGEDGSYELSLQHWRTYANGRIWDRPPHPVVAKVPLEAAGGRLTLEFGEAGGLAGHKPRKPIILP